MTTGTGLRGNVCDQLSLFDSRCQGLLAENGELARCAVAASTCSSVELPWAAGWPALMIDAVFALVTELGRRKLLPRKLRS
jgi:hypothetical protein